MLKKLFIVGSAFFAINGNAANNTLRFLVLSDIHLNSKQSYPMQIDPSGYNADNDMDAASFNALMDTIQKLTGQGKIIPAPTFVLSLGDLVGHKPFWTFNRVKFVQMNESTIFKSLQQTFPMTPIINVFGNNDSFAENYGAYQYKGYSPYQNAIKTGFKNGFLSSGVLCDASHTSFPCLAQENKQYGFFTIKLAPTLIVIGLNSVMFSPNHKATSDETNSQLTFLANQLQKAAKENISVLIAMHIPVGENVYDGSAFWKKPYQQKFLKLVDQYEKQIQGLLVAHTHMEEFTVIKTQSKNIGEYFTAGLSTSHGNSPSVKLFTLTKQDNGTWSISNYTTYQIHQQNEQLQLTKYYDFKKIYCTEKQKKANDINQCLAQITFNQTQPYFTVNNPNYQNYPTKAPEAFYVKAAK